MERGVTTVFASTETAGGFEVLVDEVAALLEVIDTFDAVTPSKLLPNDFGFLDLDPLFSDDVFPHLKHRHRVLVRMRRIEIIRRRFLELDIALLSSHSSQLSLTSLTTLLILFIAYGFLFCLGLWML